MAIQDFVTGQVLTSTQMDNLQANDYNQTVSAKVASYVLVAADKGTRITMSNAGATTITVNTALFAAGDTLFITNIGVGACTITAGTATVSTASSLVLAQYDSGRLYFTSTGVAIWEKYQGAAAASASGLTQITTGTFTSVTSKSVDSCFTSTYKNYSVIIECATDGNTGTAVTFRYRASAADLSANSYYGGYYRIIQNGSTSTTYSNPATSVGISFVSSIATTSGSTINLTFNDPLAAGYGHPAVGTYFDSSQSNVPATIGFEYLGSGTPDGFTILCANAFSGSYKIYGWSN